MVRIHPISRSHTLRYPDDLYSKLHIMADKDGRTFNGMCIHLLEIGYVVYSKYLEGVNKQIEASKEDVDTSV